ncbi:MAG: major facilitator superfamily 1 [Pseudonocardia sp.]|jgi:MFS family permease|nr:major facilitator superfamily 1 [Pseudonocardia sp.]
MVNEFARTGRGGSATTILMTGYHVGAVATALLGILLIPRYGWESMFIIGALPALVLVPLLWKFLPESDAFLRARAGLDAPARGTGKRSKNPVGILFHHGLARSTIAFWITSFMGLLLVYGLNTWLLPQIMRAAGYELGARWRCCWCSTWAPCSGCWWPAGSPTASATAAPRWPGSPAPPCSSRC